MENARRHFLRTISGVAALPAIGSVLTREPRTGLGAASSTDLRGQDHGIRPLFEFSSVAAGGAAHGSDAPYLGCQRRRTSAARPVGHASRKAHSNLKQEPRTERARSGWLRRFGSSSLSGVRNCGDRGADDRIRVGEPIEDKATTNPRPNESERISVFSFVVENGKPLDVGALLDRLGVAV